MVWLPTLPDGVPCVTCGRLPAAPAGCPARMTLRSVTGMRRRHAVSCPLLVLWLRPVPMLSLACTSAVERPLARVGPGCT